MQVVSGPIGRRRVHFEAPHSDRIESEITRFLDWVNTDQPHHPVIKAGPGHLWFVTLHPFDDGNGRVARAVGDLLLARADRSGQRFYSLSARIQQVRNEYYEILERTQKGSLDVTPWLEWFLRTLLAALTTAEKNLDAVLFKSRFWRRWAKTPLNERQIKVLNQFLDGFEGKLTNAKWAALAKCSPDTALRDITHLLSLGILEGPAGAGRSTSYTLGRID